MDGDYEPEDNESQNTNDEEDYNHEADKEGSDNEHDINDDNDDWAPQEEDSSDDDDVDPLADPPNDNLHSDEPEPEGSTGVEPVENTGVETTHENTGVEPLEDDIETVTEAEPGGGEPQQKNDGRDEDHTSKARQAEMIQSTTE